MMTNINSALRNPEDISNKLLSMLENNKMVKISNLSQFCYDEKTMNDVIDKLKQHKIIDSDGSFIWIV